VAAHPRVHSQAAADVADAVVVEGRNVSRRRALAIFYGVGALIVIPCLAGIGLIAWAAL
jgi:hypothetical protein